MLGICDIEVRIKSVSLNAFFAKFKHILAITLSSMTPLSLK